ncbi:MAG: stage 0 sporulation family protein [Clostridiaceae bacterium]|nr:stage 0 sporulation family protein [Clostridia bacterium]MBP6161310.1 stage 0 sporulation family protein [Clostridia bacterium]MBP6949382.1 stage 0 sporulation family protein [Clostridia bacterium]NMA36405.1 stage 0 sporulation family protein [Clostridiaceae bacterium]
MSYIDIDVEENGIDSVDDRELFKTYDDAYRIQSDDQDLNENDYDGDADDLVTIIGVKLRGRGKTYHFSPAGLTIKNGNCVIVETAQGMELGVVSDSMQEVPRSTLKLPLKDVLRLASDEDLTHFEENKLRETEAIDIARERIVHYELDMFLVDAEIRFDNKKITFFFTADGRIDFRELVRDLASIFRTRIELRQIGVRDEASMVGGLAVCGRELCCSTFLKDFNPVSIRLAKDQNLSMNPGKISGLCGRLLCCLNFEHEAYVDARKRLPKKNAHVMTPEGPGVVENVDLLKEEVSVRLDHETDSLIVTYPADKLDKIRPREDSESHRRKRI